MTEPQDFFRIFCRGRCGAYKDIPILDLKLVIGNEPLIHFARNYFCDSCNTDFIVLIETATPPTLEEHPEPQ